MRKPISAFVVKKALPNDARTALLVLVFGLNPSGVMENSGYPRSASPYCTPPSANDCELKNGPGSPNTKPDFCDTPATSAVFSPDRPSPNDASVVYARNSVVYRWNDADPPS